MATPSRILSTNAIDAATFSVTTGASASGYSPSYAGNPERNLVWRSSTDVTNQVIEAAWATATTIKAVVIVNYLWTAAGGTIKAEYYDGGWHAFGGGTGLFTVPTNNRTKLIYLFYPTGHTSVTKVRISFLQPGSPVSAYAELGYLFAGSYTEPTLLRPGVNIEQRDLSDEVVTIGGQLQHNIKATYQFATAVYGSSIRSEIETIKRIYDAVGGHKTLIWAIDPADPDQVLYGRFVATFPSRHQENSQDLWRLDIGFREAA